MEGLSSLPKLYAQKYVTFSGGAMLFYDYLLTLPLEVEYIWKAPRTFVKVGFLLNRYGNLVGQMVIVVQELGLLSHGSQKFCVAYFVYCSAFMLLSEESIRFIVIMRAWAVWGCTRRMAVGLMIMYAVYIVVVIGVSVYLWSIGYGSAPPPVQGICLAVVPAYTWLLWIVTLGVDTVVVVVACIGLRRSFKGAQHAAASPLIRLLLRDALLFYAATVFNSVFSAICWSVFRRDPRDFIQLVFSIPLLSIAGQRLVLNLRGLRARPWTSTDVSRVIDRELAAMDDEAYWGPVSGSSAETGTTIELAERSAQGATLNEESAVERVACRLSSINLYW